MNQSYAPPQQAPPTQSRSTPATSASEQDTHGNGYVAEGLGGGLADWLPGLGDLFGTSPEDQARQEQDDFLTANWPPMADFDTGTGGVFDVDLMGDELLITLKVAFDFVPGDPANAPAGVPPSELQWKPEEEAAFRADYTSVVQGTWSDVHAIRSTRPLWTTTVRVAVMVLEDAADPHFTITVAKYPPDAGDGPASVCDGGYHHDATGGVCDPNAPGDESGTGIVDSRDNDPTRVRTGSQTPIGVFFDGGSTTVDAQGQAALDAPVQSLVANPAWTVELTGRASAEGDATDNLTLARERTQAVAAELGTRGIQGDRQLIDNEGEEGAGNDPFDRRVDVFVIDVQNQVTSAHETGHMFGLSDEYLGSGEAPGTPLDPAYAQLIRDNAEVPAGGLPTKGEADSIMSNGMQVENWHYAPFVAALKAVTGSNDWIV